MGSGLSISTPTEEQSLILTEQNRQLKADYPLLHEMARHMVHVSETLVVALQSLQGLKQQQEEFLGQHLQATKFTSTNSKSNFHWQLQLLQSLLARSESNKARLQNEINLVSYRQNNLHRSEPETESCCRLSMQRHSATVRYKPVLERKRARRRRP